MSKGRNNAINNDFIEVLKKGIKKLLEEYETDDTEDIKEEIGRFTVDLLYEYYGI